MGEWKLVPVEPTEEMVEDGELTLSRVLIGFDYVMPSDGLSRVYHAMLAASPAPSLPEDVERVVEMLESADPYEIFGNDGKTAAALIQSLSSQLAEARNTAAAWKAEVDRVQNAHKADARLDGDMTLADVIAWLKHHRWTHSDWASWFEQHPDDPRAVKGGVGTAEFHRSVEARYNSMIDCLTAISSRLGDRDRLAAALEPFAESGKAMLLTGGKNPKLSGPHLAEHLERARAALASLEERS